MEFNSEKSKSKLTSGFLTTTPVNIDASCAELGVHLSGTGPDYKGQSCLFALKQNGTY